MKGRLFRARPPGHLRHDIRRIDGHFFVVDAPLVGRQRLPVRKRLLPLPAFRRHGDGPSHTRRSSRPGAISPARAPALDLMLHTVIRDSIDRSRTACAGILDHMARPARGPDLADDGQGPSPWPSRQFFRRPRTVTRMLAGRFIGSVCVASTCSTSEVPMPRPSAPNAPCVAVWRIAAHHRHAGLRQALLGADDMDDPWRYPHRDIGHAKVGTFFFNVSS